MPPRTPRSRSPGSRARREASELRIFGDRSRPLRGRVRISGAKNAVLPAIVASLLTEEKITLRNVPLVKDVWTILTLMNELGAISELAGNSVSIQPQQIVSPEASYELVRSMRASVLVLGPLLARYGKAYVALPGGCAIGSRPIDLHIAGMQKLGAVFTLEHGTIKAEASRLHGADIEFDKKTVGGTENLLMAATLARGETVLSRDDAHDVDIRLVQHAFGALSRHTQLDGSAVAGQLDLRRRQ